MSTNTWQQTRGKLARKSKDLPSNHPELAELRRDLHAARLAETIKKVVAQAPPFTPEQVAQLRVLLEPARAELTASSSRNSEPEGRQAAVADRLAELGDGDHAA